MTMAGDNGSSVDHHHRWSTILPELLAAVLKRLPRAPDRVRVGSVCTWWRSVLAEARRLLPPPAPMLLIPCSEEDYSGRGGHGWIDRYLLEGDITQKYVEAYCFRRRQRLIFGSSMGWLCTAADHGDIVRLWNPVTGAEVPLPSTSTLPKPPAKRIRCDSCFCVKKKVVLSAKPSTLAGGGGGGGSCVVVAVATRRCGGDTLIFCRVGDERWTPFPGGVGGPSTLFDDVICYRSQFYAVTSRGQVVLCDVGGPIPKLSALPTPLPIPAAHRGDVGERCCYTNYLVESSSGELLMVTRVLHRRWDHARTSRFVVYKLDVSRQAMAAAQEMTSLGDQALFLGSSSASAAASCGGVHGWERNCIYFLDDRGSHRGDMGVFNLEDGSINARFVCTFLHRAPRFWTTLDPSL